jgi:hypothetical protein
VLLDLGDGGPPALDVTDRSSSRSAASDVQAVDVERTRRGQVADGRLDRAGPAVHSLEGPLEHPAVLAEPGHRKRPSSPRRNQLTKKILGSCSASADAPTCSQWAK